jgi:repressor LexA
LARLRNNEISCGLSKKNDAEDLITDCFYPARSINLDALQLVASPSASNCSGAGLTDNPFAGQIETCVTHLSRFQKELLQFLQFFIEEEGRPPRWQEIGLRFSRNEDWVQMQIDSLRSKGFLLPGETDTSFLRVLSPWTGSNSITNIPLLGMIPAGLPEDRSQEIKALLPVPLEKLGLPPSENIFALEVFGDSMIGKHIVERDFVVMDKSKKPRHGDVVAALVDNQTTLKTYFAQDGKPFLRAENPAYKDIIPAEELQIQGVLVCLLRKTA